MARVKWKLNYISYEIFKYMYKQKKNYIKSSNKLKKIYIFSKVSKIPIFFLDNWIHVYKGKSFRRLKITKFNVGYRFGSFIMTRKPFSFPIKQKKQKSRK